jgi:hypothetical protein
MSPDIAIATITFDKKGDQELLEYGMELLSRFPYPVFVADGGSSERFVRVLEKMGHDVDYVPDGLTESLKNAVLRASESAGLVLYTEPDKCEWFNEGLEKTVHAYLDGKRGFAAVGRTPEQMQSFPLHQRYWEQRMNEIIFGNIGIEGDFVYGPKAFPSLLGNEVGKIHRDIGWGPLIFLVGRSYSMGIPVEVLYTASPCPEEQRSEDDELYRINQFCDNVLGFYMGLKE